jgi:hypothetical protein
MRECARKEKQIKLDEIRKRAELIMKFKELTDNLSVEYLSLLIDDIATALAQESTDTITTPV